MPTILVVDDEPHVLQVLSLKLGEAGYDVLTAPNGGAALAILGRSRPDLLITDLQMPGMGGADLCRALRDDATTRDIPIVVLTARGYALSPHDLPVDVTVVSKPFSPRNMIKVIEQRLAGSGRGQRSGEGMEAA